MKKSKLQVLVISFFLFMGGAASAMEGVLDGDSGSDGSRMMLNLREIDTSTLLSNLKEGHESRLTCTFRIYRKRSRLWRLMGDQLEYQNELSRSAYWDSLSRRFVVAEANTLSYFESDSDFLTHYLALSFTAVPQDAPCGKDCYARIRSRLLLIDFPPPLKVFNFIFPEHSDEMSWLQFRLPTVDP